VGKIRSNKKAIQRSKYIAVDFFAALIAWFLFFIFRRLEIESSFIQNIQLFSPMYNFEKLVIGVPLFWLFIFWLSGYYNHPFRKSRLTELIQTFLSTLIGSIILFFILIIDDPVVYYTDYYLSVVVLFIIYFVVVYSFRYALTRVTTYNIHNRIWGFNTLIIGIGENAKNIYEELEGLKKSTGNLICGFISDSKRTPAVNKSMIMGSMPDLYRIMREKEIEEVIVAIDSTDSDDLFGVINQLYTYNVDIRFTPRLYDFLVGGVKLSTIYGAPLVNVLDNKMPDWQQNVKRLLDIIFSTLIMVLAAPLLCYLAIRVKLSSPGPVFYKQERIGYHGKPFHIIKFRTMYENSESGEPQLASADDIRMTPIGRMMRKYRLDELPQFMNVLKGDMSIVGPRPERQYFIDQILQLAPYYSLVHKVRPGITSWGMVKYGYADSVEKMVARLNYDIIYLENISLVIDFKILIYTIITIVSGKGI
jgi:exopolysaccharide biosynthesis polyprenyl glycosylphosphotransferase